MLTQKISSVTRTEILWRTLCGNMVVDSQIPAPTDVEKEFFNWLCLELLARTYIYEENNFSALSRIEGSHRNTRWERLLAAINPLLEREPPTSIFNMAAFHNRFGEAISSTRDYESLDWVRGSCNRWIDGTLRHHTGVRRCFQDSDNRLCMGLKSCEADDEIWILAGMPSPVLLRPIEDGKYTFLGEVYIYGVMEGELADHSLLQPLNTIQIV